MQPILVDKQKRIIRNRAEIKFSGPSGFYLISITARAKSRKQISPETTDDEDLIVKIDNKVFPKLTDPTRLIDSPAAFSGGQLHSLSKTVYFLIFLEGKDPELILKIAQRESRFNPKATSAKGAKGIYQLTNITVKQIEKLGFVISDPYDIDQNITGGMMYFKWLHELYEEETDQLEKTLAAWNWGLANFSRKEPLDWKILPQETREFISYVLGK